MSDLACAAGSPRPASPRSANTTTTAAAAATGSEDREVRRVGMVG